MQPAVTPSPSAPARWCYLALAVLSLALGAIGIFLPLLPTVPFVLLAAWAAARSSPPLARWLESHPRFGPHIADWRRGGVVPRKAKWLASFLMSCSASMLLLALGPRWFVLLTLVGMAAVLAWLWRRPEALAEAR